MCLVNPLQIQPLTLPTFITYWLTCPNHNSQRSSDGRVLLCPIVEKKAHISEVRVLVAMASLKRVRAPQEWEFKFPQTQSPKGPANRFQWLEIHSCMHVFVHSTNPWWALHTVSFHWRDGVNKTSTTPTKLKTTISTPLLKHGLLESQPRHRHERGWDTLPPLNWLNQGHTAGPGKPGHWVVRS